MKVYLLNQSKQTLGGGWRFMDNFAAGLRNVDGIELADSWQSADVVLLPSASMVSKELVREIGKHKPLVLRVDNALRDSRNRGTGMSRMREFAKLSEKVVFQSKWAQDYLGSYLGIKDGVVIYNGVDTKVFNPKGARVDYSVLGDRIYLYSRYSRSESKGWVKVWYKFQELYKDNPKAVLVIVGQFSPDLRKYNFDFFQGETVHYEGIIHDKNQMARVLRGADILLAPYQYDCYSNTIQEAMAVGIEVDTLGEETGGTPELLRNGARSKEQMVKDYMPVLREVMSGG